jgi:uncharacterized small protein (DUF1192 family)
MLLLPWPTRPRPPVKSSLGKQCLGLPAIPLLRQTLHRPVYADATGPQRANADRCRVVSPASLEASAVVRPGWSPWNARRHGSGPCGMQRPLRVARHLVRGWNNSTGRPVVFAPDLHISIIVRLPPSSSIRTGPDGVFRAWPGENTMSNDSSLSPLSLPELEDRIAIVRDNIRQLVEQAAAFSGAADESRNADRIAQQTEELDRLTKERDARLRK